MKVEYIRVGKTICYRWIDHGLEIRACSSIKGNKRGIRRQFFRPYIIDPSGHLIFSSTILNSEWKSIEIRVSEMKEMYKGIRIDQVISEVDLELIRCLIKYYG